MRIVVWNCALRLQGEKLGALENLQPDIAIVPACESPRRLWGEQPLLAPIPMEWVGNGLSDHVPLIVDVDVELRRDRKPAKPAKAMRTDLEA